MSLNNFRLENKLVPKYRVEKEDYYLLYVLENNLMWKKFLLNDEYQIKLSKRHDDFLEYLRMLMDYSSDLIVKPTDIYVKHSLVTSYTYQKKSGTKINKMYPKTRLDKFLEAMANFLEKVDELDSFNLSNLKPDDILYTGDININNLDKCSQDDKTFNLALINDLLFRGIFNINDNDVVINNEDIAKLYDMLVSNKIDVLKFMQEYIYFVKSEYGNCRYVKHLERKIISSKK